MAPFLDNVPDHVALRDVAPQMDAHGLLAIEQRMRHAAHLAEHHAGDGPGVAVLLQGAHVEADGLLDDVVLAVGDQEGPVGKVHDGGHDHHAREEGRVVQQLPWEADQGGDIFCGGEALGCVDLAGLGG